MVLIHARLHFYVTLRNGIRNLSYCRRNPIAFGMASVTPANYT